MSINYHKQYIFSASAPLHKPSDDLDGNLLTNGVFSYAYDAANRLALVSSNDTLLATFAYDAQGRRVRKIVSHGGTETQRVDYVWDGWHLIRETITDLSTFQPFNSSAEYHWGKDLSGTRGGAAGIGGLLYLKRDGAIYIPWYDAYGNILGYRDAQGNVVASYTYDAFGNIVSQSGALANIFCHRFSTKYFDTETGLYYYGYRYYSPALMRWISRDPIEERGGLNLYAFVDNGALFAFDPLGNTSGGKDAIYTESSVEWEYELQYETTVKRPMHVILPIPISMTIFAALPQEMSGSAPAYRRRYPNSECKPYFRARKLTVYAWPSSGFNESQIYSQNGMLRIEPFIAIVKSGSSPDGHWEATWSDKRLLWKYEGKYAYPFGVKKHVDGFFYGDTEGTYDIHRKIVIHDADIDDIYLPILQFTLKNELGKAPKEIQ